MRVLIVDDEPLARRGIVLRLKKFKDIEIIGECRDGASALEKILALAPDVVFLDVQMPGMNGFDVLRALPKESLPSVIFLTAYEQYALQAFQIHALDYLLKPVDDARFVAAVVRARKLTDSAAKANMAERIVGLLDQTLQKYVTRFKVQTGARIQIVLAEHIEWIGAAGDYVELHCHSQVHLLRDTMASLEQRLDPAKFVRIHRSRIVRADRIRELVSMQNREFTVRLADGTELRSSRTYAERLDRWLSAGRG